MFVLGCYLSQVGGYFLACIPYVLFDIIRPAFANDYKIQAKTYPSKQQMIQSCKDMMVSFSTVVLPMLIFGGFFIERIGITRDGPIPKPLVMLIQIAYFFLVEDFLNYWFHRWLHLPWLYKHIHSVHHKYDSPFGLVAAYAHPAEVVILAIPTFVGPVAVGPHLYTLMIWQAFRNFEAIDIHSGYEFPYSLKTLFPAYAGTKHHDYHHYMHSGNFASIFTWCDRLYGTDTGYRTYEARRREKEE
ncbi:Methylsterol monooxygenase 1-3 [Gracilariopsis chorda]|uniref:Methylsterol monooxygenase 1-3 n=1 Tax=Gracilariopsis chorda TaxID=448386 RepID=A0A2V3J6U6_9FLOR|nr:Methylsterol monooxygenase 1-3 [Gracilariopsis chorda]|eukprot:PXF50094.1 Methylsterol monooxygenase 1-3 [Gracilariopsis chorda]